MTYTIQPAGQEPVEARRVKVKPGTLQANRPPTAEVEVHDPDGLYYASLSIGTEVVIRRGGEKIFTGLVRRPVAKSDSSAGLTTKVHLIQKAYRVMQRGVLESYLYDPDGAGPNGVDAVTRNPHAFMVYRATDGTLDSDGEGPPAHGHTLDRVFRHAIGTAFLGQIVLKDSKFLDAGEARTGSAADAYANESELAALTRLLQSGGTYGATGTRTTIPLRHGSEEAGGNANILALEEIVLLGTLYSTDHPTVRVARDGDAGSPAWESLPLSHTSNYNSSGLDAWTLTTAPHTFTTGTQKDALLIEITVPGSAGDPDSTRVNYVAWDCSTDPDTTITEGTISTYSSPYGGVDADWFEGDLAQEENRLDAIEAIREQAVSTSNPDGRWDAWIDDDLEAHFVERRGSNLTSRTYSERDGTLSVLEWDSFGDDLAYQIIAKGAGQGTSQLIVVDDTPANGLYDSDRDPAVGALYGDQPARMKRTYPGATTALQLRRRAQADLIHFKDPREFVKATVVPDVFRDGDVGDSIQFKESRLGKNAYLRIHDVELIYSFDGGGESIRLDLGSRSPDIRSSSRASRAATQITGATEAPRVGVSGLAGTGVPFDRNKYARVPFTIPEGVDVDRVFLEMQTVPFQVTAKAADFSAATTENEGSHTHSLSAVVAATANHTHAVGNFSGGAGNTDTKGTIDVFNTAGVVANETLNTSTYATLVALTPPGGLNWTDFDWVEVTVHHWNDIGSVHDWVGRIRGATSGLGNYGHAAATPTTGLAADTVSYGYFNFLMGPDELGTFNSTEDINIQGLATTVGFTDEMAVEVKYVRKHFHDRQDHTHTVAASGGHTHSFTGQATASGSNHNHTITVADVPLEFGIFQYAGDGEDPETDPPLYGEGIEWAVDPSLDANGVPSAWGSDKHPMPFGDRTKPTRVFIDVTPFLAQDAQGKPTPGIHYLFLLGTTLPSGSPANVEGLSAVSAAAVVKKRDSQ